MNPPTNNKLIVAAAGSGKTTFIVEQALALRNKTALITTYTQANKDEILNKIVELNGTVPSHVEVETWFSFLFRHGIKPYQGSLTSERIKGLLFVASQSAFGVPESNTSSYYFHEQRIYSDKLSKFATRSDDATDGSVLSRLSRIYDYIYIDEVQDMCGYDLEFISRLFSTSIEVVLVGDPRQATYTTHPDNKYKQYKKGGITDFVSKQCGQICTIDKALLSVSHRNHQSICIFSSLLFPEYSATLPCSCAACRVSVAHAGVFLVSNNRRPEYESLVHPIVLRYSKAQYPEWNFGQAKGKTFNHTLIYPTADFEAYLMDGLLEKVERKKGRQKTKARFDRSKLYVASTRARYSLGILCSDKTLSAITVERLAKLGATIY